MDRIIRTKEAAKLLGVSATTLWRMARAGVLVPVHLFAGMSGYRESQLQAFIDSRKAASPDRSRVAAALASPLFGRRRKTLVVNDGYLRGRGGDHGQADVEGRIEWDRDGRLIRAQLHVRQDRPRTD